VSSGILRGEQPDGTLASAPLDVARATGPCASRSMLRIAVRL
jgi:hypothetical protein